MFESKSKVQVTNNTDILEMAKIYCGQITTIFLQ